MFFEVSFCDRSTHGRARTDTAITMYRIVFKRVTQTSYIYLVIVRGKQCTCICSDCSFTYYSIYLIYVFREFTQIYLLIRCFRPWLSPSSLKIHESDSDFEEFAIKRVELCRIHCNISANETTCTNLPWFGSIC